MYRYSLPILGCWLASSVAWAQRGATYEGKATPWEAPSQGYPGYLDTNVARKGSIVVELPPLIYGVIPTPSTAVDYGVTDTVTVGTNGIVTAIPWLFGAQGLTIKARSLLIGTEEHQSAATFYAGYVGMQHGKPFHVLYQNGTWNHAWRPAPRHTLTGHFNYLRLSGKYGKNSDLEHISIEMTTAMAGVGYGFTLGSKTALRVSALASLYSSFDLDTVAAGLSLTPNTLSKKQINYFANGQFEYHMMNQWLLGIGAINTGVMGAYSTLPWITLARRW